MVQAEDGVLSFGEEFALDSFFDVFTELALTDNFLAVGGRRITDAATGADDGGAVYLYSRTLNDPEGPEAWKYLTDVRSPGSSSFGVTLALHESNLGEAVSQKYGTSSFPIITKSLKMCVFFCLIHGSL